MNLLDQFSHSAISIFGTVGIQPWHDTTGRAAAASAWLATASVSPQQTSVGASTGG
jgi:hypothetical protein